MQNFDPTTEDFYNLMQQLYPDQSARVIAEIRVAKMQQYIKEQQGDDNDGTDSA